MKPLYCISAVNRITMQRERISGLSTSKEELRIIYKRFMKTPAHKRTHIYPRINVSQEEIFAK